MNEKKTCDTDSKCFLKIKDGHICEKKLTWMFAEKLMWYCKKEDEAQKQWQSRTT